MKWIVFSLVFFLLQQIGNATLSSLETTIYSSENGLFLFLVEPGSEGIGTDSPNPCVGTLFKKGEPWQDQPETYFLPVWRGVLNNVAAPVNVAVSNDGNWVVTFDDWGSHGIGPNVVVVYNSKGKVARRFSLKELIGTDDFSKIKQNRLPFHWMSEFLLKSDSLLEIGISIPSKISSQKIERKLTIELETGKLVSGTSSHEEQHAVPVGR